MSYFYDENGHLITDPAIQRVWVEAHPEFPYGEHPNGPETTDRGTVATSTQPQKDSNVPVR